MSKIPIGLELYSVRDVLKDDPRGTLKAVAEMGYDGVEFFGAPNYDPAELRGYCDEFGLEVCGWHTPYTHVQDDMLESTIAFNKTLGNNRIIIPMLPAEYRQSLDDWRKFGVFLSELADKLEPHDMITGYHNHNMEFEELDGGIPWFALFDTASDKVIAQLDNGHAFRAGADVVAAVKRYPGQAKTVHLKPYSRTLGKDDPHRGYDPVIGQDEVPWKPFFAACESVGGTEWYIVEYESDVMSSLEAVKQCVDALRAMGK